MKAKERANWSKKNYFVQMAKSIFLMKIFAFYTNSIWMFLQLCTCLDDLGV